MSAEIDLEELNYFLDKISKVDKPYMNKRIKQHLQKEGNKLKRATIKLANEKVKKDSGNYHKGIKRGKVYLYKGQSWSIRTYNTKPHAHLIEDGHRIVTKDGREVGFVRGKKVFKTAEKDFQNIYIQNTDAFVDAIIKEGLGF